MHAAQASCVRHAHRNISSRTPPVTGLRMSEIWLLHWSFLCLRGGMLATGWVQVLVVGICAGRGLARKETPIQGSALLDARSSLTHH